MINVIREPLIFEISSPGKTAFKVPELDVPEKKELLADIPLRADIEGFPEVSETEITRHFTRLSQTNYCVDLGIYPLGSCTMKYNPKINEKVASLPGFIQTHPLAPEELVQGNLELMKTLEKLLLEITGMDAITLQPAAGAHGELTGMMLIRAYHQAQGNPRKYVLIPDSAHGTNPSSAHLCGYTVKEIKSNERGTVSVDDLSRLMDEEVAALMLTNPNTLGVFESDICQIADIVHSKGGFLYMDGANLNALAGITRPGDLKADVMHLNLHKTFSTPHGGGGPGSGPVAVKKILEPFLPVPVIEEIGGVYHLNYDRPQTIGRVRSFYGQFLVALKALAYILSLGPEGIKEMAETAVLNSNYIRKNLEGLYELKYDTPTLHECVFSDKYQREYGVTNLDISKRLLDYGLHPPTMSFPLIVHGALMIEPTETESRCDLDLFIEAMKAIAGEAKENPELLKTAPHITYVRRLDEVQAARNPILRWEK
ncbi:MAG TPA: aminomethyl-transferring glycine dehydrogenase subunit GcvPB [Candidatus Saccharicenans sp.]|nr:aminomethyl-transferring glycine dehydrogenase subunit GcvPB [Candidatus Saccharicenans sp.]HQO75857.1 aminomethyl-transferring glycine dehydrogenase subunit GcvPB [Candidatus Saccharicenans sp.]HUM79728.1 aminomethyl-transferring glycine dehydrogenase subunit GcvPB [Candidatus Saccharicenans sp.]